MSPCPTRIHTHGKPCKDKPPKNGVEGGLKLFDEFVIPVGKTFKTTQDFVALIIPTDSSIRNRLKVLMKLFIVEERRK